MSKQLTKQERIFRNWNNYLFDHPGLKFSMEYSYAAILAVFSGLFFSFGFVMFIQHHNPYTLDFVTGGVAGVSQVIYLILRLCNVNCTSTDVASAGYLLINIPIIIFAFKTIGVKFSIFTLINVAVTSVCLKIMPTWGFIQDMFKNPLITGSEITRALFAGVCTGVSSGIAFKGFFSTGGFDVISYYLSNRSSKPSGRYIMITNFTIVLTYTVLNIGYLQRFNQNWTDALAVLLYVSIYQVIVTVVVDLINVRNKKVHMQIITEDENMPSILIANFPHTSTILKGQGSYTKRDKLVITMAVSSNEAKKVTKLVRMADPYAFIEVSPINNVYGKFFVKPIK